MYMVNITARECRFVEHVPAAYGQADTHIVKELLHHQDGTTSKNLRVIKDFRRPFWVTKEHKRNHKQKKESEELDNLMCGSSTESDLGRNIAIKLGATHNGVTDLWTVRKSPYVYGIDVNSRTYIKNLYQKKYPNLATPYEVCVFDIETDTLTNEITIISIATREKIYTVISKKFLQIKMTTEECVKKIGKSIIPKLEYLYQKHIPEADISKSIVRTYDIAENELEAIKLVMARAHEWQPDIMAVWNIDYDVNKVLDVLEKNDIPPESIFCDPSLPKHLKTFKYVEGAKQKTTASGKFKPVDPKDRWHKVYAPATFCWLDAMCAYNYIRIGGKAVAGGYSLDNILKYELGNDLGKLKFDNIEDDYIKGIEWHQHMTANNPLEYIIYNQWDVMSVLELDAKTKDLKQVISMLSGLSNFDVFNSGPKRIIDALHFFYLDNGRVLGCKSSNTADKDLLGLGEWIVLLPSCRIADNGVPVLSCGGNNSNARMFTYDSDQVSGLI